MKVLYSKTFHKDLKRVTDRKLLTRLKTAMTGLEESTNLSEAVGVEKLRGWRDYYRIRVGDYRIGFRVDSGESITFLRCLHRKEIYHHFP